MIVYSTTLRQAQCYLDKDLWSYYSRSLLGLADYIVHHKSRHYECKIGLDNIVTMPKGFL